jgi:hypothetical protein
MKTERFGNGFESGDFENGSVHGERLIYSVLSNIEPVQSL